MKNLLLAIAFILTSFFQLSANVVPKTTTLNVVLNEKAVVLNNKIVTDEQKMFTITNQLGTIVFTDVIEENKRRVKYDLKRLPNGNYSIKIGGTASVEIYEATISADDVSIINSKSFFRPTIQNMNHKIIVSSKHLNNEDIQVSIYDNSNTLVYRSNDQKTGAFKKLFNLEQLAEGDYNVVVSTDYFSQESTISL